MGHANLQNSLLSFRRYGLAAHVTHPYMNPWVGPPLGLNSPRFHDAFIKTSPASETMKPTKNKKSILPILIVPSCILMVPAAAMLFSAEGWVWDAADFVMKSR
jgi:hypothetical protein